MARVPTSVRTGSEVTLTCFDGDASPPPTYKWYKDGTPLPAEPQKITGFKNATYKLDTTSGNLVSDNP